MNIYQKYLVCYDIENDKTRKKFFEKMKDLGLISIQKSVFYGDLNQAEFSAMKKVVLKMLDPDSDKCFWTKCTLSDKDLGNCFGYKNFKYIEPDGYESI